MKTVLITGATDGIGLALARHYHAGGARLVLVGRRAIDELDQSLFSVANYCRVDLAQPDCAQSAQRWLDEHDINILDMLILNAGAGYYGAIAAQPPESIDNLIAVNLRAPISLTHTLLPRLQAHTGQLVFISSVAATLPVADYAVYGATKAALDGFARNLHIELHGEITVQSISPGATNTGMHAKSGMPSERVHAGAKRFMSPEAVAQHIVTLIERRTPDTAIGVPNQLLRWAGSRLDGLVDPLVIRAARNSHAASSANQHPMQDAEPRRVCVITGAADGIGRALAVAFVDAGYAVVGVDVDTALAARTQAELRQRGADVSFIIGDLSSHQGLARVEAELRALAPFDVFIHNAGINHVGRFKWSNLERQQQVLSLNFAAPLWLSVTALREGWVAGKGSFVFISSLSRFASYPGAAVYAASKDGLAAFARSLAVAQAAHVLTVFPGPTRASHARRYSPDNTHENRRMPPEQLAALILNAIRDRRRTLIPGLPNQLMATLGRWMPAVAEYAMRRGILDKLGERRL